VTSDLEAAHETVDQKETEWRQAIQDREEKEAAWDIVITAGRTTARR